MDVCNVGHVENNMNFNQENALGMQVNLDWRRIGEVYSNSRRQCLIVCMICETFASAYTTNDASAFWNHVQTKHFDYPLFQDNTFQQNHAELRSYDGSTYSGSTIEIADTVQLSNNMNLNNSLPPEKRLAEPIDHPKQREAIRYSCDTLVSDTDTNDSNTGDYRIVTISDAEDAPSDSQNQQYEIGHHNVPPIEISDNEEEEFISAENIESSFATRSKELYSCELCGELFIDQDALKEHNHDFLVNKEVQFSVLQQLLQTSSSIQSSSSPGHLQNYSCRYCNTQLSSIELLEQHQSLHTTKYFKIPTSNGETPLPSNGRAFKCNLCGVRTNTAKSMDRHHQRYHSSTAHPKITTCRICKKVISLRRLRLHMDTVHANVEKMKCAYCGRWFGSRRDYEFHMEQVHAINCSTTPGHA